MAYYKSTASSYRRRGARKGYVRRKSRYVRSSGSRTMTRAMLAKYVDSRVKRASRVSSGPPRSVSLKLLPANFNRQGVTATAQLRTHSEWELDIQGPDTDRKYVLLPIAEAVPIQRHRLTDGDDRFRSLDTVRIKGVSLRLTLTHAESVRLQLFAFANGQRRGGGEPITPNNRPFVDRRVADGPTTGVSTFSPMTDLYYEVMTRRQLFGEDAGSSAKQSALPRQIGEYDGPFAVRRTANADIVEWKSVDGTSFTTRRGKEGGRPVGRIYATVDGSRSKQLGSVANLNLQTSSLMRTVGFSGAANTSVVGQGWVGTRFRTIEFFVKLDKTVKYRRGIDQFPMSECPLELFLAIDVPQSSHSNAGPKVAAAAVTGMDYDVYFS